MKIYFILSTSSLENIGLVVARGPGLIGLLALFEINPMVRFCNVIQYNTIQSNLHTSNLHTNAVPN